MIETPFGDKYQVLEVLRTTTAGEAYRATMADGTMIVISVVRTGNPDGFLRYVANASGIDHPNVARVLDWGRLDERCFVVREAVQGNDLGAVLAMDGRVAPRTVAQWGAEAAAGLAAIHRQGIVHGLVSPATLVRTPEGGVKVVDVGLAAGVGPADLSEGAPPQGAFYVSPEEVLARPRVPASDIYSLGVVLYQLASGRLPFEGPNALDIAEQHAEAVVQPLHTIDPAVPQALDNAILRALSKTPEDRYASATDMQKDLERAVAGRQVATPPMSVAATPEGKRHVWPWILVVLALAAAVAVILWATGVFGGGGPTKKVPDVTGLTLQKATKELENAGFSLGDVTYRAAPSSTTAEGTVLEQDPAAGTKAEEGSKVNLVVSGTQKKKMPDLIGMSEADATKALTDAGFSLDRVQRVFSADVPVGMVVDQAPSAGSDTPLGTPVTLAVSKGPAPTPSTATVPSVIGKSQADAVDTLRAAGFSVFVKEGYSSEQPPGAVFDQTPTAGVKAETGTMVTIMVSKGPSPPPTSPPSASP